MQTILRTRWIGQVALAGAAVLLTGWPVWGMGCDEPTAGHDLMPLAADRQPAEADGAEPPEAEEPTPSQLMGLEVGTWRYRVTNGDREGELLRVDVERKANDEALPWRRARTNGRVEHLAVKEDGSLVLGAVEDPEHGVITRYDPPLTLIPAELPRDEALSFEVEMRVTNLEPPHRERGNGTATRTIRYVGDEVIESPVGDFTAKRLEVSYRGRTGLARITIDAVEWYHPEVGMVAEDVDEQIRAALIFGQTKQETIRLHDLPEPVTE